MLVFHGKNKLQMQWILIYPLRLIDIDINDKNKVKWIMNRKLNSNKRNPTKNIEEAPT